MPCPLCKAKGFFHRCNKYDLESLHETQIDDVYDLISNISEKTKTIKKITKTKTKEMIERKEVLEVAHNLIEPSLQKIKNFLNTSASH